MSDLTEAELRRRRPVWEALSELFLDTETRPAVCLAAAACEASGFSDHELENIWRHEISPVLAPNLLQVAGEWALFDIDWLEAEIVARRPGLLDRASTWVNRQHWSEVVRLSRWLRTWPESHRERVTRTMYAVVWTALESLTKRMLPDEEISPNERERIWHEGARPLLTALHFKAVDPPLADMLARGHSLILE